MLHTLFSLRAHADFREQRLVWFSAEQPEQETQEQHTEEQAEMGGESEWDVDMNTSLSDAEGESAREAQQTQQTEAELEQIQHQNQPPAQPQFRRIVSQQNVPATAPQQVPTTAQNNTLDRKSAAEQELGLPSDFKKLSPEERERKIADAMKHHGVSVEETASGYTVTAPEPNAKFDVFLNRATGFFQSMALTLAPIVKKLEPVMKKFREFGDKISGKTSETSSSKEEVSRKRVEEKLKKQPDRAILEQELTTARDTAKKEKEKAENEKKNLEAANTADRQSIDVFRADILATDPAQKDVITGIEKKIAILEAKIKANETKIGEVQKKIDEQTKIVDEAELDLKSLAEIQKETRKEKEEKKVASIPNDGKWHEAAEIVDGEAGWSYKKTPDGRGLMYNSSTEVRVYQPETGLWVEPVAEQGTINNPELVAIYNFLRKDMAHPGEWCKYSSVVPNVEYSIDLTNGALLSRNVGSLKVYTFDTNTQQWNDVGNYDHEAAFNNSEKGKGIIQERNEKEMRKIASIPNDGKWHEASEIVDGEVGWKYKIGPNNMVIMDSPNSVKIYQPQSATWETPSVIYKIPQVGRLNGKYNGLVAQEGYANWMQFPNEAESYSIRLSDGAMMRKSGNDISALNVEKNAWESAPGFDPTKQ